VVNRATQHAFAANSGKKTMDAKPKILGLAAGVTLLFGAACSTSQLSPEKQQQIAEIDSQIQTEEENLATVKELAIETQEEFDAALAVIMTTAEDLEARMDAGEDVDAEFMSNQAALTSLMTKTEQGRLLLASQMQEIILRIEELEGDAQLVEQEGLMENATALSQLFPGATPFLPFVLPFVPLLGKRGRKRGKELLTKGVEGFNPFNTHTTPMDALLALSKYAGISRSHGEDPQVLLADTLEELDRLGYQLVTDTHSQEIKAVHKPTEFKIAG